MYIVAVNDTTLIKFIEDTKSFENCSKLCFRELDTNKKGKLSREELRAGFGKLLPDIGYLSQPKEELKALHDVVFDTFDADKNGVIDGEEFKSLLKESMLAMARGIGGTPVLVALQPGSLLMMAVEHELPRN